MPVFRAPRMVSYRIPPALFGMLLALSATQSAAATYYWNRNSVLTNSSNFSRSYNWTANADGTGAYPASTLDDDFTTNNVAGNGTQVWTYLPRDSSSGGGTTSAGYSLTTNNGQLTLTGRGLDIYGATNQFVGVYRTDIQGNFFVSVKVVSQTNTAAWAKAGIMVANDLANIGDGGYATVVVTPGNGVAFQYDLSGSVGQLETNVNTGGASAYPIWLALAKSGSVVTAYYKTAVGDAWTQVGSAQTPQSTRQKSNIALVQDAGTASPTCTVVFDDFAGGGPISATGLDLSLNGTGANADVNAVLGSGDISANSLDMTGYAGTLDFGGQNGLFATYYDNTDFTSTTNPAFSRVDSTVNFNWGGSSPGGSIAAGTWSAVWEGYVQPLYSESYTFYPSSDDGQRLWVNGSLLVDNWVNQTVTEKSGTIALTAGVKYPIVYAYYNSGGGAEAYLRWASASQSKVIIPKNCLFAGKLVITGTGTAVNMPAGTVTASDGQIEFSAAGGTQILVPRSGQTLPRISHTGAGTLQLSTNALTTSGFSQSAGTFDFNGLNVTTSPSGPNAGNFQITSGGISSFANLGGRTITVAGSAGFAGSSGSLVDINPVTGWTIASTGALTASYALIANSNASVSTGAATNSQNGGGNSNWNISAADYSSWNYSTTILFNTTSTGANVTSNLVDFPLLVRLDSNNFIFDQAFSDGRDVRFTDPDGTNLGYEIERWDAASKKAEIWVSVPQIDGNSANDFIKMYWGGAGATAQTAGKNVFNTSNGYASVLHLNETGNTTAGGYGDATGNGNTGTGQSSSATQASAVVGYGQTFNGTSQYIVVSGSYPVNTSSRCLSGWVKTTSQGTSSTPFAYGGGGAGNQYFGPWVNSSTFNWEGWLNTTTSNDVTTSKAVDREWHHLAMNYDGATVTFYLDGTSVGSGAKTLTTGSGNFQIGNFSPTSGGYFPGTIDQVEMSNVSRSADWIKFAYYNQKPNGTALTYSNSTLSTWSYSTKVYINTTATGANTTTDVTGFPLLVRLSAANFNFSQAKSDGGDLRFADSTGALLSYEIERFDAADKAAEIWVLIPTVKGSNNAQWFRMYWGKAAATSLSSANAVFQTSNSYLGAWHLNASGTGTRSNSCAANAGLTTANYDADEYTTAGGYIAGADSLDGTNDYLDAGSGYANLNNGVTFSIWAYPTSAGSSGRLIDFGSGSPVDNLLLYRNGTTSNLTGQIFNNTTSGTSFTASGAISLNTWQKFGMSVDASGNMKVYKNGLVVASGSTGRTLRNVTRSNNWFGRSNWATDAYYKGKYDEIDLANTVRSDDWMKLEYESQKTGTTTVKVGARTLDFTNSVRFNFNTTSTGANVSGNVANIPILVRLNASNFKFSATRDDGADIQFIDKDGTYLYHQVVGNWDKANQTATVWVKAPQVDGNSTTDYVTLYYGCSACTASPYAVPDSVFSAYQGVWHLNGSEENQAKDATRYKNPLTYNYAVPVGSGVTTPSSPYFDGTATNYAYVNDPSGGELDVGTADFTLMGWVKTNYTPQAGTWMMPFGKENTTPTRYGYGMLFNPSGASGGKACFEIYSNGTQITSPNSSSALNDGAWHFLAGKKTSTAVELFVDGVSAGTTAHSLGTLSNGIPFLVGGDNSTVHYLGNVNDVNLAATAFSPDYIKLSYENQKAASTLFSTTTIAPSSFQNSRVYKLNTTASGSNVPGDVYNFPLLLRITSSSIIGAVQSGAPDIRFLDGDGVIWLDYQIERWDQANNLAEVWVRIPRVIGNSASQYFTLYYGQAPGVTVPDGQCASCVFGTSNGFAGAWHLSEAGNNTADNYKDATSIGANATGNNMAAGTQITANAGLGQNLNGSSQYVDVPSGATAPNLSNTSLTVGAWLNRSRTGNNNIAIGSGPTASADQSLHFGYRNNNMFTLAFYGDDLDSPGSYTDTNTWVYWMGTFDYSTKKQTLYRNGAYVTSRTAGGALQGTGEFRIGLNGFAGSSYYFGGGIDEVTAATVARDSNWAKLVYETQKSSPSIWNPSIADFQKSKQYTFNTTKTGANVLNNVAGFPLLLRISGGGITAAVQGSGTSLPPDIRFLDGDGKTWLNYQVERWDRNVDSAEVWVMVPQVDGNSDHDFITLYYQQASGVTVADGQCASCVFGSYAGAYHLSQDPGGSAPQFTDASGNGNHGTAQGGATADGVSANDGKGFNLNGSSKYVSTTTSFSNPNTFSNSCWFKTSTSSGGDILNFGDSQTGLSGSHDRHVWMSDDGKLNFGVYHDFSTEVISSASAYNDGNWHLVTARLSNSTYTGMFLFVDGAQVASNGSITYGENSSGYWRAGFDELIAWPSMPTSNYFNGTLDEVRFRHSELSNDFIKLNYETQRRSGNKFWNGRAGPNNKAALTATAGSNTIALGWSAATLTDSANADSVGIWVKYSAYPDSANAASTTRVAQLSKSDSAYNYPATYPGTYYFGLAVRNSGGAWSPITASSSDTAVLAGNAFLTDTVYVDSALGSDANTCAQAVNPALPKLTITNALTCGSNASDTLVVRVLPGTYANDNYFAITSKPSQVVSFDPLNHAVLNGSGTYDGRNCTIAINSNVTLRRMDVKAGTDGYIGVYVRTGSSAETIDGCRIYNNGNIKHSDGIYLSSFTITNVLISNNLIYQPTQYGLHIYNSSNDNIINNVFYGPGGTAEGFNYDANFTATNFTINNNIFYNWNYGIRNVHSNDIGLVSNNLFYLVTTGREVVGETDNAKVLADPRFNSLDIGNPKAFILLPGSPAIDAGTSSLGSNSRTTSKDFFRTARPVGTAPDIGLYEGTGYTPNPAGEFDSLATLATSTTVTVKNAKWKLVFDKANGGGINFFSDMADSATNLLASGGVLFDAKIGSYTASANVAAIAPALIERSRARAIVRQWITPSASLNVKIYYSIYPSGHIYVHSEVSNLANGSTALTSLDYTLKLGTTTAAYTSGGTTKGFGYLTTSTRDALLTVTRDLDGGAATAETWTSTATSGTPGSIVFATANASSSALGMRRDHQFLLYIGESSMDFQKAAVQNADGYAPSVLTTSAGSLHLERSWQEGLNGHWNLDDGAGSTARDKAVFFQNHAALTGANYKWVSGKVGGGLYLTVTDKGTVTDNEALEASKGGTYMFWIKPDWTNCGTTAYIVSKGTSAASTGWYFRRSGTGASSAIAFTMGGVTVTGPALTDGVWTHIAAVANSAGFGLLDLYVNGVLVATSTSTAGAVANAGNLLFGNTTGGTDNFQGTLDDIRVFKNEIGLGDIQAVYAQGFSAKNGHYALRADNNNRLVTIINGNAPQSRMQPAFQITNWYGAKTPKYVYLNGTRLKPNTDYVADSIGNSLYGAYLVLQLNKILTGADQTLFLDDDDSTGYMGSTGTMKSLTMSSVANDKLTIKNFPDTVFGGATSGQWYLELDLNGWTSWNTSRVVDTGFGGLNVWKAAAINPNIAISSATNQVGQDGDQGRSLAEIRLDATGNTMSTSGCGYAGPANLSYTLADSSATRLSLTLAAISLQNSDGTATLTKRWTVYPTGRVFGSFAITAPSFNLGEPSLDVAERYNSGVTTAWASATAASKSGWGFMGGDLSFHSMAFGLLTIKNATSNYNAIASGSTTSGNSGGSDYQKERISFTAGQFTSANAPITVNFFMDISKDFADSATADSLLTDVRTPAVLTAIGGAAVTNDALDFNGDGFAEGDGAYTYAAATTGIAQFKFANTVASFNPAFRISSWTFGVPPEIVILDNQVLTRGYHYNAYLNTATNEVVMQLNKTLAPGTHVVYVSHKTGLAVTLRRFEARDGDGVDTLSWTTESEFENLGYHVWRRVAPAEGQIDSSLASQGKTAGAGIANALAEAARNAAAAKAAAKLAAKAHASGDTSLDTLPSLNLNAEDLAALGYVRLTAKLIPGAKGGSSATTREYGYIDRTADLGVAYEYLLEAVDFGGDKVQYGPRTARPSNSLATELFSNYPNPFNPITTLRFALKDRVKVSLVIYDSRGRVVRNLIRPDKPMVPGKYRVVWDAKDDRGLDAPSGQYFYRFSAPPYVKSRKMILVK